MGKQQARGACTTGEGQQAITGKLVAPSAEGQGATRLQPVSEQAWAQPRQAVQPQGQPAVQFLHGACQLLLNPNVLVFFGMVFVMGYGVGNIEGYLFLYLDSLGGSEMLMGLTQTVTCVSEFLVFFFSGDLLRTLGEKLCMQLVFLAFVVRLLCYATLASWGSPWMVLIIEPLHGFTFALAWATGTAFASKVAPPGLETTTQAVFQGLYYGLGFGVGGLAGGVIYQHQGPQRMYWMALAVMLAGWLLTGVAELFLAWRPRGDSQVLQEPVEVVTTEFEQKET